MTERDFNRAIEDLLDEFQNNERVPDFLVRKDELQIVRSELKDNIHDLKTELKDDIHNLRNDLSKNHLEMKNFIESSIAQTEIKTLKQFMKFWTTGAAIAIPVLTGIITTLLALLLP